MTGKKYHIALSNWHPTKLNELMNCHWTARKRKKDFDANCIAYGFVSAGVPNAECRRRISLEIILGPRQRGGDPDCYWKSLLDGLVRCGALVNDSKEWCELGEVSFRRGSHKGAVIILENLPTPQLQKDGSAMREGKRKYKVHLPGDRKNFVKITSSNDR